MKNKKVLSFTQRVLLILFFFAIALPFCNAMESERYKVITVLNNTILTRDHVDGSSSFGLFPADNRFNYKDVSAPSYPFTDFGQSRCQKGLKEALAQNKGNTIICASSEGTATVLNALAQLDPQEISWCKGVILENVMISGNSLINRKAHLDMKIPLFPGCMYLLPYLAKMVYPFYSPGGQQPIFSIEKIPKDFPIIIIQRMNDLRHPAYDAQALYYKLSEQGNNNVYFIKHDTNNDNRREMKINYIRRILQLIPGSIHLLSYQPDYEQLKADYDLLVRIENRIRMISKAFSWMFLFGGMAFAYKYILPLTIKEMLTFANILDLGITVRTNFYSALAGGMKEQNGVHNL